MQRESRNMTTSNFNLPYFNFYMHIIINVQISFFKFLYQLFQENDKEYFKQTQHEILHIFRNKLWPTIF